MYKLIIYADWVCFRRHALTIFISPITLYYKRNENNEKIYPQKPGILTNKQVKPLGAGSIFMDPCYLLI